jgi:hypothetical protein
MTMCPKNKTFYIILSRFLQTWFTRLNMYDNVWNTLFVDFLRSQTDKKENEIFLIYVHVYKITCKEIQMGSVSKSYLRNG